MPVRLVFLVQGKDVHKKLEEAGIPDDVVIKINQPYGQDGDNLFIMSFEGKGESLDLARKMAEFRDSFDSVEQYHLLIDDPSERFCERLYARFGTFERTLRSVLRLALCSEKGNFKHHLIKSLENQTLDQIYSGWFCDNDFIKAVGEVVLNKGDKRIRRFSKEQLLSIIEKSENNSAWNQRFPIDTMTTVRERFKDIQAGRNDVMHFHRISYEHYKDLLDLLERASRELEEYVGQQMLGLAAPLESATTHEPAIIKLDRIYVESEMYKQLAEQVANSAELARIAEEAISHLSYKIPKFDARPYSLLLEHAGIADSLASAKRFGESINSIIASNPGMLEAINRLASFESGKMKDNVTDDALRNNRDGFLETDTEKAEGEPDEDNPIDENAAS